MLYAALGVAGALVLVAAFAWWMGVFMPVKLEEMTLGPFQFISEPHVGSYESIGKGFGRMHAKLQGAQVQFCPSHDMAVFYDNPDQVESTRLRSHACIVLDPQRQSRGGSTEQERARDETETTIGGFEIKTLPAGKCLVWKFPCRYVPASFILGAFKFYPALKTLDLSACTKEVGADMGALLELYLPTEVWFVVPNNRAWFAALKPSAY